MPRSVLSKLPLIGVCLSWALFVAAAHADVYKYKDEKGNVLYTDKPQYLPAERLSIKSDSSNIVDLDQPKEDESNANDNTSRPEPKESPAQKRKAQQSMNEGKAEACNKAREDYRQRMAAQRLYEDDGKGNRRFLNEKEIEASRSSAKQAMDALCN